VADHRKPQHVQRIVILRAHDTGCRQDRVIRVDVRGILGGLFNGFHFIFTGGVVERAHHNLLPQENVFCGLQVSLYSVSLSPKGHYGKRTFTVR
jgi:hypothetical protein